MHVNQILGIVLLIAAAALLYFGYTASQGVGEQVHESVTGGFTDSTTWYFVFGIAAGIGGLVMLTLKIRA
ncbi:MAG: DUF3185 family protein [Halospina sp.]